MMLNFKKINVGIYALSLIIIFTSGCKKDPVAEPQPSSGKPPLVQELAIDFSAAGIAMAKVERAIVVFKNAENFIKSAPLQTRTNALYTSLDDLQAGSYTLEINIQTKKENDNSARAYSFSTTIVLPLTTNFKVKAPKGSFDDEWYQRAVLFANNEEAIATVAMDPGDAFYEVRFKEALWQSSVLQRVALYHSTAVAGLEFGKNLKGLLGFAEYTAFDPFTKKMQGKLWTKGTISLYLQHKDGRKIFLDYAYNK